MPFRKRQIKSPPRLAWLSLILILFGPVALCAQETKDTKEPAKEPAKEQKATPDKNAPKVAAGKLTAEQVAELAIYFHGSRQVLQQIRRTGLEHGRIVRNAANGRTEEATYDLRFARGESAEKDKLRLDQQMPTIEYSLIYNTGKVFGLLKGAVFIPRQDAADDLLVDSRRGIEALLRYKENGATLSLSGKEKQQNVECHILDLTDKEGRVTRYYISVKYFRVLWTEYEETAPNGAKTAYKRRYYDYRYAQGTLVPFRSVLYRDGQQISEIQVLTVTYGAKVDDAIFLNPEQAAK